MGSRSSLLVCSSLVKETTAKTVRSSRVFLEKMCTAYADCISIVAVHGLGGHYRSTWEWKDSNTKKLWLEDFLIDQLRDAGINA